jgi:hypothetical protein
MKNLRVPLRVALLWGLVSPLAALAQDAPSAPLVLSASVTPETAPPGTHLAFRLTVTNPGDETAAFTVGDCPVRYRIDGRYSPRWSCGKAVRTVSLGPGQSTRFDADVFPGLRFDPRKFPLEPGPHRVTLAVEGLGGAEATFTVEAPSPGTAAVAGRILLVEGFPATEGTVTLNRLTDAGGPEPGDGIRAPVSKQGMFLLSGVEPGEYLLRASTEGGTVWYPGVGDPLDARRLVLEPGMYRGGLELAYSPDQAPVYVLAGRITERSRFLPGHALEGAVVVAVPEAGLPQSAVTGEDGRFKLEVPAGHYRLLAGRLVNNRYRYWNGQSTLSRADRFPVPNPASDPTRFHIELAPLGNAPVAVLAGHVFAFDPGSGRPPRPLSGARVVAVPLLPAGDAAAAPLREETGDGGAFAIEVPPDTPYRLQVEADGYASGVYPEARRAMDGAWLDVEPGGRRPRLDVTLVPRAPESSLAAVEGIVVRKLSPQECRKRNRATCLAPVAGAVVRIAPAFSTVAPFAVRTRTGDDGRFRAAGLPPGPGGSGGYYVSVEAEDGDPAYYPEGTPFARAAPLHTEPGKTANAGQLLVAGSPPVGRGRIRGSVAGEDGQPVAGARVRIRGRWEDGVRTARTNADGDFVVRGLPEGEPVRISAEAAGYVPGYFPDACRWTEAGTVIVPDAADSAPPVRMMLRRSPGAEPLSLSVTVRGRTDGGEETPLAGAFVYAFSAEGPGSPLPVAGTVSAENGAAILTGLPAGAYFLMADRSGYAPAYFAREAPDRPSPVLVAGGEPAAQTVIRLAPAAPGDAVTGTGPPVVTRVSNVPNPFRPRTDIRYTLDAPARVTVQVFDYRGRLVRTLVAGEELEPGPRQVAWDGRDDDGKRVSSGVYFYRILAGTGAVARKMVLLP